MMFRSALLILPLAATTALAEERSAPTPALDLVTPIAGVMRSERVLTPLAPAFAEPESRRAAPLGSEKVSTSPPDAYMEREGGTSEVETWWTRHGDTLRRAE